MRISYAPLWKTMEKEGITTYRLIKDYEIGGRTINNLKHDVSITMLTLMRHCEILHCTPNEVVKFIDD